VRREASAEERVLVVVHLHVRDRDAFGLASRNEVFIVFGVVVRVGGA